jgi:hypothetical protein
MAIAASTPAMPADHRPCVNPSPRAAATLGSLVSIDRAVIAHTMYEIGPA